MRAARCMIAALLAACSANPPAPPVAPAPPPPPAPAPPAPSATPRLGLVVDDQVSLPRAPATSGDAPEPLDRAFVPVPLPADAPPIVAVDGRDDRDVWLLGQRGHDTTLFHWDGARFTREKGPACKERPEMYRLVLVPGGMIALGSTPGEGDVNRWEARRSEKGGWSCAPLVERQILALGSSLLRFDAYKQPTLAGARLPRPDLGWEDAEIAGRSPEDLWIYHPGSREVLHGNGVSWERRFTGLASVRSLRVDDTGAAWLVGGGEGSGDEGDVVLRWDVGAHAWKRLPAPADLRAQRIRVASEREVWLIGREHVHHWDGRVFHRGVTPIKGVNGAWISPSGELWLTGGAAFRTEKKP